MKELLQLARGVLLFKHEAYVQHIARADALKRGLILLVLATLVAGSISLIINVVGDLHPTNLEDRRREAEEGLRESLKLLEPMRQYLDLPPGFEQEILKHARPNIEMGFRIAALPTRLPKPVGGVLQDLGAFLSSPFSRMAKWLGYGIWVLLVAKLLGGRATVAQALGATALYAVPHALDILSPVPCLGGVIGLVTTMWGIVIYVKALAVANDFSIGRAVASVVVPALAIGALALTGLLGILTLALMSAGG
jgi:hypothetical protein